MASESNNVEVPNSEMASESMVDVPDNEEVPDSEMAEEVPDSERPSQTNEAEGQQTRLCLCLNQIASWFQAWLCLSLTQISSCFEGIKNRFCCIWGQAQEEGAAEEDGAQIEDAARAPKALSSSVKSLMDLENDQRRISGDIMKIEAQAEEITASFIGGMTYVVSFSGAGLFFGNPVMPCRVILIFVSLIIAMFGLAVISFFIIMVIRIRRLNPIKSDFDVRRDNIVEAARAALRIENHRDPSNPEDPNSVHPTASQQAVKDRLNNILQSKSSITLEKFYCQVFWLTVIYVGLYGSILGFVAYYTFCTVKCKCPATLGVQVN